MSGVAKLSQVYEKNSLYQSRIILDNDRPTHYTSRTDFATESAQAFSGQMLMQSSSTMLKQTNSLKQMTLSLIQQ